MARDTKTPEKQAKRSSPWYWWVPIVGLFSWLLFLISQSSRPEASSPSLDTADNLAAPASIQPASLPADLISDPNAHIAVAYLSPPPNAIPAEEGASDQRSLLMPPPLSATPEPPRKVEVKMNAPKRLTMSVSPSVELPALPAPEAMVEATTSNDDLDSLKFETSEVAETSKNQSIQIAFGAGTNPSRMSGVVGPGSGSLSGPVAQIGNQKTAMTDIGAEESVDELKFETPDPVPTEVAIPSLDPPSLNATLAPSLVNAPAAEPIPEAVPMQRLAARGTVAPLPLPEATVEPLESRAPTIVRMAPRVLGGESRNKHESVTQEMQPLPAVEADEAVSGPATLVLPTVEATVPSIENLPATEGLKLIQEPKLEETAKRSIRDQAEVAPPVVTVVSSPVREVESTVRRLKDESVASKFNAPSMQLVHRGGQTISMPGAIARVQVSDESICETIRVGEQDLSLIGSKIGRTQVTIWLDEAIEGQPNPVHFEVEVQAPWQAATAVPTKNLKELQSSVNRMHRDTRIEIRSNADGSLTVVGSTLNEESAKQILNLIRKLCLVPVHDQVVVKTK